MCWALFYGSEQTQFRRDELDSALNDQEEASILVMPKEHKTIILASLLAFLIEKKEVVVAFFRKYQASRQGAPGAQCSAPYGNVIE